MSSRIVSESATVSVRVAAVCAALLAVLLHVRVVGAVNACVPPPGGVVGMPGPPDPTVGTPTVDDPRWHGASGEGFPDATAGGAPDAQSRLLQDAGSLYLQLHILADPSPGNSQSVGTNIIYLDSVYVGFADATFANVNIVRIAVDSSGGTHPFRWTKSGGTWAPSPASPGTPAWLGGFTAWVNPPINGTASPQTWAVTIKINTAAIPGTKFWYGTTISPTATAKIETYAWPNRGNFIEPSPPDTGASATTWGSAFDAISAAHWGDYTTTTGTLPLPAGCGGVRIESNDIGTTNALPYQINDDADNTFRAQLSGTLPAQGAVKARFRIANWGMQIGVNGDWHDIPHGGYADNHTNDASGLIQFSCSFAASTCPTLPGPSAPADQCMLVELQPAAGAVSFSKDSAWRNMIFGPASSFEHDAEISLFGLPPDPTPRDVYLYVKASNMPSKVDPPARPGEATTRRPMPSDPRQEPSDSKQLARTPPNDPYWRYRLEGLNYAQLRIAAGKPTYEVRGYRDTGLGSAGGQVLAPMVPFGYFIEHNGVVSGWSHELIGVGTVVTTVIPDVLYKISVLPGQKARIKTKIAALEPQAGPPPVHCNCDFRRTDLAFGFGVVASLLGLIVARRHVVRRRKTATE
jgi:hypothetical protein